jgi:tRNA threonylcarbamoyl adenosine modification protein YeaZ
VDGLVLALDAGSPMVSVAAGRRGAVLAARAVPLERSSTQLLALIDEVLAAAGARAADLAGVVALAGPGSFTGLRVGLATALGLHQALGARALALPTLAAMAAMAAPSGAPPACTVIAAVDALRGEWSAQAFRAGGPAAAPSMPAPPLAGIPLPLPLGAMQLLAAGDLLRLLAPGERRTAGAADGEGREVWDWEGGQGIAAAMPPTAGPPWIVTFGVAALRQAAGDAAAGAAFIESPPLAPAALRLAAAVPLARWQAARLAAPIYSRPPATTAPRRRHPPAAPEPR